jgi:hypothetical protein
MKETAMCWGFECNDGWYKLIDKLSSKLEAINKRLWEDQSIWKKLFTTKKPDYIVACQVKEKYGSLSFYFYGGGKYDGEAQDLVSQAESESAVTCEFCGKPGRIRPSSGWLTCLCPECREKEDNFLYGNKGP